MKTTESKMKLKSTTYRMPAEWEKHKATWLTWPHNPETWPDLAHMKEIYGDMISALTGGEDIRLLVNDSKEEEDVRRKLSKKKINLSKVTFLQIPTTDAWIRDYGPNFIVSSDQLVVNQWVFNAWGEKYEEHKLDNEAAKQIISLLKIPKIETNMVLESGSIDSNGKGTILTTEECLLNSNRNESLTKAKIESKLRQYLGAEEVIWLSEGIEGDDTDGHIDDIARFVNENTVVCVTETNPKDDNYQILCENKKRLLCAHDQNGKKLNVVDLPMPKPLFAGTGERLPASYANFYIGNRAVLVPVFGDPNDKEILKIFKTLFPNRSIVGISSNILVHGLGGIHCITHEEPAVF